MTIICNILLSLASLLYILFQYVLLEPKWSGSSKMSSDNSGMLWSSLYFILIFSALLLLSTIFIYKKGNLDGLLGQPPSIARMALAFCSILITIAVSAMFKYEPRAPIAVRYLTTIVPLVFPLALIIVGFILNNDAWKSATPIMSYKMPLLIILGISALSNVVGLIEILMDQQQRQAAIITEANQRVDENHARHLADIAKFNPQTDAIILLLSLTGRYHDEDVKTQAVAKIKAKPTWEQELLQILESEHPSYAFTFLDAHEVDHKELFAAPMQKSIELCADEVRQRIKQASYLRDWEFEYMSTDRILGAIDKMQGSGIDYRPSVQRLRDAFDEPFEGKKFKFNSTPPLDSWLKSHK